MSDEKLTVNIPASTTTADNAPPIVPGKEPATPSPAPEQAAPEQEEAPKPEQASPEQASPEEATPEQAAEALKGKGLDVASFEQEFEEKGELSAASYKKLADAGFSKDVVDRYIQAGSIIQEKAVADVKALAGGDEGYSAMTEWAKGNLSTAEIEAFNRVTNTGDMELIKLAVSGLHARYTAAEGKAPQLVGGKANSGASVKDVFRSTAEVVAAMRDPRYGKDAAYTKEVELKMGRSDIF